MDEKQIYDLVVKTQRELVSAINNAGGAGFPAKELGLMLVDLGKALMKAPTSQGCAHIASVDVQTGELVAGELPPGLTAMEALALARAQEASGRTIN